MSRKNTLFQRIRAAATFVVCGRGKVRIMNCEKCGGMVILPITAAPNKSSYITDTKHIDATYSEFVQCARCGAVCEEIQLWNFSGDPKKINPDIRYKDELEGESAE